MNKQELTQRIDYSPILKRFEELFESVNPEHYMKIFERLYTGYNSSMYADGMKDREEVYLAYKEIMSVFKIASELKMDQ